MIVGIFHPVINWCGGAELVATNIIKTLKLNGQKVVILTDEEINRTKIYEIYKRRLDVDGQIVLPFAFFQPTDSHNIYTDMLRSLVLKSKCDILIDTISNTILPGADVAYIHYPLLKTLPSNIPNKTFFLPYRMLLRRRKNLDGKIVLCNSEFTKRAIREVIDIEPYVLYPPISTEFLENDDPDFEKTRNDTVVTVARISQNKNLEIIPYVAKLTDKSISFVIIGLLESEKVLKSISELIKKLKLSDRVRILTNVERDRVKTELLSSKVYFHSKPREHFGISIIEAMASGCIPIVHDSGGAKEFVPKELRYQDSEDAARKIEKAVSDWSPICSRRMFNVARRFDESSFSNKFLDILRRSGVL